ncbi:MAG: hypothetical protein V3U02_10740 [Calditrichia bacterium]
MTIKITKERFSEVLSILDDLKKIEVQLLKHFKRLLAIWDEDYIPDEVEQMVIFHFDAFNIEGLESFYNEDNTKIDYALVKAEMKEVHKEHLEVLMEEVE